MTSREIRALLILKGLSQASIARDLGVSRQAVNLVVKRKARSREIEAAIAKAVGLPVCIVWNDPESTCNCNGSSY